jgi:hypothetical protein
MSTRERLFMIMDDGGGAGKDFGGSAFVLFSLPTSDPGYTTRLQDQN